VGRLIQTNTSYVTILCGLSVCRRKPIRIFPSRELLEQKNTIYIRANYRASRFVRVKSCTYTIETRTGKRGLKRFLYLQILVQVQARARWIGGAWMDEKEECGTVRVCVCVRGKGRKTSAITAIAENVSRLMINRSGTYLSRGHEDDRLLLRRYAHVSETREPRDCVDDDVFRNKYLSKYVWWSGGRK